MADVIRHSYQITAGSRAGLAGYWYNNAGTINGETYTLPNGNVATIRQTLLENANFNLRIVLNQACLLYTSPSPRDS